MIAKNLRTLRIMKGLSQQHLAWVLDITKSRIGAYEEGRSEPGIAMLIRFADFYHVTVDDLIRKEL